MLIYQTRRFAPRWLFALPQLQKHIHRDIIDSLSTKRKLQRKLKWNIT